MSDNRAGLPDHDLPEGARAAEPLAADSAPDETTVGQGTPDADHGSADGTTPTGGVVDSGMPDHH